MPMQVCAIVHRSTPACAGEAQGAGVELSRPPVYPRVCGGSPEPPLKGGFEQGLSPRVRGKPPAGGVMTMTDRSIPACAGEAP